MSRERKKPEEVEVEEGRGRALSAFPFQFSVEKEERGEGRKEKEVGMIFRRGNAGVVPPDLHWATESTSPLQLLLFLLCLCDELEMTCSPSYLSPMFFSAFPSPSVCFSLLVCLFLLFLFHYCTLLHFCVPTCIHFLRLSSGKPSQSI